MAESDELNQALYDPDETLEHTPTWAVGVVCIMLVVVSTLLERFLKRLSQYLERANQIPLQETLHRMREDLMMLGFLSLFLTASRNSVTRICVSQRVSDFMLPCSATAETRRHFSDESSALCPTGKVPLMSSESIHQLHMFLFVMAVVHVFYSCLMMILARLQMKGWGKWEEDFWQDDVGRSVVKSRRLFLFVADRTKSPWRSVPGLNWLDSFCRQFWNPVRKADYLNLRLGFVQNHNAGPKFNFLKYMIRAMEEDFKTIVGISPGLWVFVIGFMLLNIYGWYTYFWIAFIPVILLLAVGTKLQHIITRLAMETASSPDLVNASIKPRDELFWFNRPQLMLSLIHFILFQNSFELSYFCWLWATYGIDSCFMEGRSFVYLRVFLGSFSQVLCSYTTLPLYALVTQMGSSYKEAIFAAPKEDGHHFHKAVEANCSDDEKEDGGGKGRTVDSKEHGIQEHDDGRNPSSSSSSQAHKSTHTKQHPQIKSGHQCPPDEYPCVVPEQQSSAAATQEPSPNWDQVDTNETLIEVDSEPQIAHHPASGNHLV